MLDHPSNVTKIGPIDVLNFCYVVQVLIKELKMGNHVI